MDFIVTHSIMMVVANVRKFSKNKRFLMIALDHRGSFEKLVNLKDPSKHNKNHVISLKETIIAAEYPYASGILVDPDYGLPAYKNYLKKFRPASPLPYLLCIEKSGYVAAGDEEKVQNLQYAVSELKSLGASGVKLLLYFNPEAKSAQTQLQTAQTVHAECQKEQLPFFLEIVTYPLPESQKSTSQCILDSLSYFLDQKLVPDVWKLEFPGDAESCRQITERVGATPWILLTKGGKYEQFRDNLRVAITNGASGFLAGRSIWQEFSTYSNSTQKEFFDTIVKSRFEEIANIVISR